MPIPYSLALFSVLLLCATAQAQPTADPKPPASAGPSAAPADPINRRRAEFISHLLQADVHVRAGQGLKAVRVGSSFQAVLKAWGRPIRSEDGHLLGTNKWYYRADYFTEVRVDGKKFVEKIVLRGKPGSPFQTTRGAGFGMPAFQISALYGAGRASRDKSLIAYPQLGISFRFASGALEGIEVYAPSGR
ncbi:MAG: hypothetical protein LJE84_04380 [Gammaproteobacteria bacterium]|nr:hypothetical protein [Gammaproteobacteria bacterium]